MPRIDPVTGCTVMTEAEFWNTEATHEGQGRSGAELRFDFLAELEAEATHQTELMRDPSVALAILTSAAKCCAAPRPRKVLAVLDIVHSFRLSSSSATLALLAERWCGMTTLIDIAIVNVRDWTGSRLEPPEHEEWVEWLGRQPRTRRV